MLSWDVCRQVCALTSACGYWSWRPEPRAQCGLFDSTDRVCRASYSPSLVSPGTCQEERTTSTDYPRTSTTATATTTTASSSEVTVILGGMLDPSGGPTNRVEVLGDANCDLPELPFQQYEPSAIATTAGLLLACGGHSNPYVYVLDAGAWQHHSTLLHLHPFLEAVSLQAGVLVFSQLLWSEFLPSGSHQWQAMPSFLLRDPFGSRSVATGPSSFLVIGGDSASHQIEEYHWPELSPVQWPSLQHGRTNFAAAKLNNLVIVTGGHSFSRFILDLTEIVDLTTRTVRPGGRLVQARAFHGMAARGERLLTFGGEVVEESALVGSEEVWDSEFEQWIISKETLEEPKYRFGCVTLQGSGVCR